MDKAGQGLGRYSEIGLYLLDMGTFVASWRLGVWRIVVEFEAITEWYSWRVRGKHLNWGDRVEHLVLLDMKQSRMLPAYGFMRVGGDCDHRGFR